MQTNKIFSIAGADAEDNVTQKLSGPDNDNSNLICPAESPSESEYTLYGSVQQNLPSTSTGATHLKIPSIHHHYFRILCMILSLVTRINGSALYLTHNEMTSSKEDHTKL